MDDISLHVLDIAENSIRAEATRIEIILVLDRRSDLLSVAVNDNGKGMDEATLEKARDPFFSTKHKKTGLGIPLLTQAAEQTGGSVRIDSAPGRGTRVAVTFRWGHVDRPAVGSMSATVLALIAGHPDVDVLFEERDGDRAFRLDTRELKRDLEDVPINSPGVLEAIRGMLQEQTGFEMDHFKLL